ncbi:hypothetical protein [Paenarthrobacter sp. C1]|uniref:hypothetical protein n=1 Tax=Paenarthrobacter sp. C1 TaxID=3400220 RepID=UPI003BF59894
MDIDFWTRFAGTPLKSGLGWAIAMAYFVYVINISINRRAVSGTLRSYRSATIIKTLIWPLFAGYFFFAAIDLLTREWLGAFLDVAVCVILLRDWERYKDSDDWWKGKGTKLKKKLRSMFTASSPAMAGAGA